MTTIALKSYKKIRSKISSKVDLIELPSVNWGVACVLGVVICLFLLFFYVWQVNSLTKGYYLIGDYENKIMTLEKENKNLQISFAESSFWVLAMDKIQALNFQKATSTKYIQIPDSSVATIKK